MAAQGALRDKIERDKLLRPSWDELRQKLVQKERTSKDILEQFENDNYKDEVSKIRNSKILDAEKKELRRLRKETRKRKKVQEALARGEEPPGDSDSESEKKGKKKRKREHKKKDKKGSDSSDDSGSESDSSSSSSSSSGGEKKKKKHKKQKKDKKKKRKAKQENPYRLSMFLEGKFD
eukprot:GDKI01008687.1.p1 GENE.GDKI01008687.1~~GDKI01008687.1.p1  ORF type:complete len:178 (-),score=64.23 GDKI01008687.1:276-809(-)